jgi:hypothetical protein
MEVDNEFRVCYEARKLKYLADAKHRNPQSCFTVEGTDRAQGTVHKAGFLIWAADRDRCAVRSDYALTTVHSPDNLCDFLPHEEFERHASWSQNTPLKKWCEDVGCYRKGCDFKLVTLIKYLYIDCPDLYLTQVLVMKMLSTFSFWPGLSDSPIKESQFWSENHILLFLSSAYLFKQKFEESCLTCPCMVTDREVSLLKVYLRAHCLPSFGGVYEVNSPVYLPWSMCALLNLFDHARDVEIKLCAQFILGKITRQCVLSADRCGVCSLAATCRMPDASQRLQPWTPRLNQLMHFIFGQYDPCSGLPVDTTVDISEGPSIFGDLLALSVWVPPMADEDPALPTHLQVSDYATWSGFLHLERMNHKLDEARSVYRSQLDMEGLPESEAAPFYW